MASYNWVEEVASCWCFFAASVAPVSFVAPRPSHLFFLLLPSPAVSFPHHAPPKKGRDMGERVQKGGKTWRGNDVENSELT